MLNRGYYKRGFDIIVLGLAHVFLSPLWLALWVVIPILIWLEDREPVFYRQERTGKDGQVFTILKFRTMVSDAESRGPVWSIEDDPRVTHIGKLLRRTGLDELPEVLSILKGDMSLVGPRPLPVEEQRLLERQIPGLAERLKVRPGLTGLAQTSDQYDDARTKLAYDLKYIEHMNPWLDLRILLVSVWNTLAARWDRRHGKPVVTGMSDYIGDRGKVAQ